MERFSISGIDLIVRRILVVFIEMIEVFIGLKTCSRDLKFSSKRKRRSGSRNLGWRISSRKFPPLNNL